MNDDTTLKAADIGAILVAGGEARRDGMREAYEKVLAVCAECDDVVLVEDAVRKLIEELE